MDEDKRSQWEKEVERLEIELRRQVGRANRAEERHAHLRRRVRELLRVLPVDLGAPAVNYRLIVAALVSPETERIQKIEDDEEYGAGARS